MTVSRATALFVGAVLVLGVAGILLFEGVFEPSTDHSTTTAGEGRASFLAEFEGKGCTTRDEVVAAADARGWVIDQMAEGYGWCHAPTGLSDWVGVMTEPYLPFSTDAENTAVFGFDAAGCHVPHRSATGPGTTCPDL